MPTVSIQDHKRWGLPLLVLVAMAVLTAIDSADRLIGSARAVFQESASNIGDPWPNVVAATTLAKSGWPPIYRNFQDVGSSFIYPPFAAMAFRPFAGLDQAGALAALSMTSRLLYVLCLLIALALAWRPDRKWWAPVFVAVAGTTFYPLLRAVELNQATLIVTSATGAALWLLSRGNAALAGMVFALAVGFKPHLVFVVPLMLWCSRRFAAAALAMLTAMLVASIAYAGWSNHIEYVTLVGPRLSAGYAYYPNQSWLAALLRLRGTPFADFELAPPSHGARIASALIFATTLAFAAAIFHLSRKRASVGPLQSAGNREDRRATLGLALAWLSVTLASPVSWEHHYAPALFAYALLVGEYASGHLGRRAALCAAISFPLVACYIDVRSWTSPLGRLGTSYVLAGGLLLFASLALELLALRQRNESMSNQVRFEPETPESS